MVCYGARSRTGSLTGGGWIHKFAYVEDMIVENLTPIGVRKGPMRGDMGANRRKRVP